MDEWGPSGWNKQNLIQSIDHMPLWTTLKWTMPRGPREKCTIRIATAWNVWSWVIRAVKFFSQSRNETKTSTISWTMEADRITTRTSGHNSVNNTLNFIRHHPWWIWWAISNTNNRWAASTSTYLHFKQACNTTNRWAERTLSNSSQFLSHTFKPKLL